MTLDDPIDTLARTIYAEARSGGAHAMAHVASVVLNRAAFPRWWGSTILTVCRARWQFSSWNPYTVGAPPDRNYEAMIGATAADPMFSAAIDIASRAVAGTLTDETHGADSYYALSIQPPAWTNGATHTLDDGWHSFWITRHMAHAPVTYGPQRSVTGSAQPPTSAQGAPRIENAAHPAQGAGPVLTAADELNAAELDRCDGASP